ncbi:MAG TPA: hypothetical protein VF945_20320, partial [Polyangia bacterium]
VPPQQLEGDFIAKPLPQLAEGEVPGNLAIAAALCQWKLKPQPQPVRAVVLLGFKPIPRRFH